MAIAAERVVEVVGSDEQDVHRITALTAQGRGCEGGEKGTA
jgi:hypothetical protein